MTRLSAIAAAAVAIVGTVAIAAYVMLSRGGDIFAQCRGSVIAGGGGEIGGPFTLVNHNGQIVTDKDVFTQPALVYFGYTFCPDVCPVDNARNAEAADALEEMGHEVNPVFISIDPARDTPEALANYVPYMHERMIGLTGSEEQVRDAAKAYRVFYQKQAGEDEFYLVNHTTMTYLVLPGHGFVEFFRRDESGEQVAQRAACFLDAAS
jgi:protein SCO1/2